MNKEGIINIVLDLNAGVETFAEDDKVVDRAHAVESLREALKAANGGSTVFNYRNMRRNHVEICEIIEQIVDVIVEDAYAKNNFFNECVDWVNIKKGDRNEFVIPSEADFVVCDTADGINTPRRQRLSAGRTSVPTHVHTIRMYDEFSRFMAGRIDWNMLCEKVAAAFLKDTWTDIYTALEGVTDATRGMNQTYVKVGSYDEDELLELCAHVEAATGMAPVIVGTSAALKNCKTENMPDQAKQEMYNGGYYGKFYGYTMVKVPQLHKANSDKFAFNDKIIHVIAGGQKFIKFVDAGESYIIDQNTGANADRTIEYLMEREYGVGLIIVNHCYGKYTIQ